MKFAKECLICKSTDDLRGNEEGYFCQACLDRFDSDREAYKRGEFPLRTTRFNDDRTRTVTWEYHDGTVATDSNEREAAHMAK